MIVSIDSLSRALARYIESDLAPSYPIGTPQRVTVGIFGTMLNNHPERMKRIIVSSPFALTVVSDDGENVDIDELADAFEKNLNGGKFRVTFPVIGQVGFDATDIAKIKEYTINS